MPVGQDSAFDSWDCFLVGQNEGNMRKRFFKEMDGATARLSSSIRAGRFAAVLFAAAIGLLLGGPASAQTKILPCGYPEMFLRFYPESFMIPVGASRFGWFSVACRIDVSSSNLFMT